MKKYTNPECSVIIMKNSDIIAASVSEMLDLDNSSAGAYGVIGWNDFVN